MSTGEDPTNPVAEGEAVAAEAKKKLDLQVDITDSGPCKKHLKISVPREDVERQFDDSLGNFRKDAAMPGFRPGRAPRNLVQKRYRKEVSGQVKSALLMACMEQIDEDYKLNPITQPDFDLEAIELPDDGPMSFEMDIEVPPDFDVPDYKALTVKRPVKEIGEADVDAQLKAFLERYATLVPKFEGGAEIGDFVTADLTFHRDGLTFNQVKEIQFRLQPELRFQDGRVPDLAGALLGAKPGDAREADAQVGSSSPDPALRGQTIRVTFNIQDLKAYRLPEVDGEFLRGIGFDSVEELREALRGVLGRRFEYQQRQAIRRQVVDQLAASVPFDLPADLVARQERSTAQKIVQEMKDAGLGTPEIRAREAEVRADAHAQTLRSLKEYFLLAKIADSESIKVEDEDIEAEVEAIAERTDESPRRIRARLEKEGLAEGLAQQLLERKTLDLVLKSVTFEDVPMDVTKDVETLDEAASLAVEEPEAEVEAEAEAAAESS